MPILHPSVSRFGTNARSRNAEITRRAFKLGKSRRVLLRL
jgi:hypothetical protein